MADPPFGFGLPGAGQGSDGSGSGDSGGSGGFGGFGGSGSGGSGGPGGTPGEGGPMGPFGDPQQFADALRQFADLMGWQGGRVNGDLAKNVARQTVAAEGDPSVLEKDRQKIVEAIRLADLWLYEVTVYPPGGASAPPRTGAGLSGWRRPFRSGRSSVTRSRTRQSTPWAACSSRILKNLAVNCPPSSVRRSRPSLAAWAVLVA